MGAKISAERKNSSPVSEAPPPLTSPGVFPVHEFNTRSRIKTEIPVIRSDRSEEHTSELQSRGHLVCLDLASFPTRRSSDLKISVRKFRDGSSMGVKFNGCENLGGTKKQFAGVGSSSPADLTRCVPGA